ncbi:MAG: hypothetical protein FJ276_27805, partial [Planctomycetes bacterium]|nr:hypothetical protein [Planctomycetota bacterium]
PGFPAPPYYDVSGDGYVTAIDALLVINYLNALPSGEGEGEGGDGQWLGGAAGGGNASALVETGLGAGLLGGQLVVTPSPVESPDTMSSANRRTVSDSALKDSYYAQQRTPATQTVGSQSLAGSRAADLEELLDQISGDIDDLTDDDDARESFFARYA